MAECQPAERHRRQRSGPDLRLTDALRQLHRQLVSIARSLEITLVAGNVSQVVGDAELELGLLSFCAEAQRLTERVCRLFVVAAPGRDHSEIERRARPEIDELRRPSEPDRGFEALARVPEPARRQLEKADVV